MDELIDIVDLKGKFTGKTELKSHAHSMGLFHATTHIWFYTKKGEILLQKRGKEKNTFPLLWDVSVAGHIAAGEFPELAAKREVEEEIGIQISTTELQKIGVFKSEHNHANGIMDYEFHHCFLCELKLPITALKAQVSEIAQLRLIAIEDFYQDVVGDSNESYVPHKKEYYEKVILEIKKRIL